MLMVFTTSYKQAGAAGFDSTGGGALGAGAAAGSSVLAGSGAGSSLQPLKVTIKLIKIMLILIPK